MNDKEKNMSFLSLKNNLNLKKSKIGIFGLGYVGLPLSINFIQKDYKVIGFDVDKEKVNHINKGKSYLDHIDENTFSKYVLSEKFEATLDFSRVSEVDAIILCLPTPLSKYREPDLSYILNTLNSLKKYFRKGQVLSLESTTYPRTTEEVIKPLIEEVGLEIGEDFFLIYSPEREDPGNQDFNTTNIPKILGGVTSNCKEIGVALYEKVIDNLITVRNTKTAEMTKLLENIHRSVNIGLVNELKPLAEKMGIDLFEVIRAAATKPFGFVAYYPGPGIGGHCIPIDPFYLTWKAREYGMHTRFIELAGEINASMPNYVVDKINESLNSLSIPLKGSKILILGVSYKKNVGDLRESPALQIMKLLTGKYVELSYSDPFIKKIPKTRNHSFDLTSVKLNEATLSQQDAVVLITDHDSFNYEMIHSESKLIIDTRGRFNQSKKVLRA